MSNNIKQNQMDETILTYENVDKTQYSKFLKKEWTAVEKPYENQVTKDVLGQLIALGKGTNLDNSEINIMVCGDKFYAESRNLLKNFLPINESLVIDQNEENENKKNTKKKLKKQIKKKDEIIAQNIKAKFMQLLDNALSSFKSKKLNSSNGFRSLYAEVRLITFMYCCNYFINNKQSDSECYELVIGIGKTLKCLKNLNGLSQICCQDLNYNLEKLKNFCSFKYEIMCEKYPRLCLSTKYDSIFPTLTIKPYESQINLMDAIKKTTVPKIFLYKAMIGSGKTSFFVALANHIENLRLNQKATGNKGTLQLIFACTVEVVRREVCRMAYFTKIPFAIAVLENGIVKIINNFNCKKDENRILIVADLDTTYGLLSKNSNYILFLDEPTVGADMPNNPVTKAVAKILLSCPNITILSSATLPTESELSPILDHFNIDENRREITTIYSKESMIGCEIINFDGNTFTPHENCKNISELKYVILQLKTKPFIDRLYTAPIVYKLRKRMLEFGLENIIDLEICFSNTESLSQNNIQRIAIELLEKIVETNNNILIEKICKPLDDIIISEDFNQEDDEINPSEIIWEEQTTIETGQNDKNFDLNKIFTEHAYKFAGPCLVVVNDPIKFAWEKSQVLLGQCDTASKIINKYNLNLSKFTISLDKMKLIKNEDERSKKTQEIEEHNKPMLLFPNYLRVNTLDHLKKFASQKLKTIDKQLLQNPFPLETLPLELGVPDWIMTLLFAGIGIYAPSNSILTDNYNETILSLATDGQLSFLISDDSICYGANYPFLHVVIDDEMSERHSILSIFQLAGRAGRVGQSWVAFVHTGDKTIQRIKNYILGQNDGKISEEAINLNEMFIKILDDTKKLRENNEQQIIQNNILKHSIKIQNELPVIKMDEIKEKYSHLKEFKRNPNNDEFKRNPNNDEFKRNPNNDEYRKQDREIQKISYNQSSPKIMSWRRQANSDNDSKSNEKISNSPYKSKFTGDLKTTTKFQVQKNSDSKIVIERRKKNF